MATSFDSTLSTLGINRTSTTPKVTTAAASQTLGQSDFLKLMTAQLQNQDPFAPMDNTQMVAQMAQFSSLAGISEMSTTLKAIGDKLGATGTADAVAYIGKSVLTAGDTAFARTAGGIAGAVELGADASKVAVTISDAGGNILKTVTLADQKAGTIGYEWDGTTDAGAAAGAGPFTVKVSAQDAGKAVAATGLVWAPVQSVSTTTGAARLTLPGIGEIAATAVRQIG